MPNLHEFCDDHERQHAPDDQIEEWRVLKAVMPIFLATHPWALEGAAGSEAQKLESDNGLDLFIGALGTLQTKNFGMDLSGDLFDECHNALIEVLLWLETHFIANGVMDAGFNDDTEYTQRDEKNSEPDDAQQHISLLRFEHIHSWIDNWAPRLNLEQRKKPLPSKEHPRPSAKIPDSCNRRLSRNTSKYPKLTALVDLYESKVESHSDYLKLTHPYHVYKETVPKLQLFVRVWEHRVMDTNVAGSNNQLPLSIPPSNWKDPKPAEFSRQLFDALKIRLSKCVDRSSQRLNTHAILLQLTGFQFEEEESMSFDTFFSCRGQGYWKQSRFSQEVFDDNSDQLDFVNVLCDSVYQLEDQYSPASITHISVHVAGSGCVLTATQTRDRLVAHNSDTPTMAVAAKLDSTAAWYMNWRRDKAELTLSLARSLLHLIDTPWADELWTAESIHVRCHQASDEIPDSRHSYLLCRFQDKNSKEDLEEKCARGLNSLADLLHRIEESGMPLDDSAPLPQRDNIFDTGNIHTKHLESPIQRAIEGCRKFKPLLASSKRNQPRFEISPGMRIREVMYKHVIRPLEEYVSQYQRTRTQRSSLKTLASSSGSSQAQSSIPTSQNSTIVSTSETVLNHQPSYESPSESNRRSSTVKGRKKVRFEDNPASYAMLSDAKRSNKDEELLKWKDWLRDFTSFRKIILPNPIDPENSERIRVTIIDTGVDASHPYIKGIWSSYDQNAEKELFYNFLLSESDKDKNLPLDNDGHGTFIAGLMLQLAPDIELSVARIGETRISLKSDADVGNKVAHAITHALNYWKAQIISLSLGCEQPCYNLRQAVQEAVGRNVIFMAAVGNSGNRKPLPYPAYGSDVFKIFATDHFDKFADFTPEMKLDAPYYSYGYLGCGVVSTWPCELREQAIKDELEVFCESRDTNHNCSERQCDLRVAMSGSSFATPMSAALVAIIYQFYITNKRLIHLKDSIKDEFMTRGAMSAILNKMAYGKARSLQPMSGAEDFFRFEDYRNGKNFDGKTYIEFFAQKLAQVINYGRF